MSLAAARMALDDAKYDPAAHDPYATSVVLASGSGGNEFGQREIQALWSQGRRAVTAYQSIAWFYAASVGQTSILHGTKGPAAVLVSDGAGGLDSLGAARRVIRRGTPGRASPAAPRRRCRRTRWPARRRRPDDGQPGSARPATSRSTSTANGYAPGEGGAVLVVEDADGRRGARRAARLRRDRRLRRDARRAPPRGPGAGLPRSSPGPCGGRSPTPGVTPDDVDFVFADGAGTPALDALEAQAIRDGVRRPRGSVPVTAPQGFVGRLVLRRRRAQRGDRAAGDARRDRARGRQPDHARAVRPGPRARAARSCAADVVLVNARGHGGFNSSIVLKRLPGGRAA